MDKAAFARRRTGQIVGAPAPDMVLVLGDVGQLQEIAEGADDGLRRVARQRIEEGSEFGAGGRIALPGEAHGGLADALDNFENLITFLLTHGVAERPAKEPDVGAEGFVLLLSSVSGGINVS